MSRRLTARSIDHVVLERGDVANTWKTERWDSLRLLTPNWQSRLPGFEYDGDDADGYMAMPEVISFIERYAQLISAPIHCRTTVTAVRASSDGYVVATDQGSWRAPTVVLATGACNVAHVPAFASAVPPDVAMVTPLQYRRPNQLDDGGVLVVGASATGIQLADEIHRSGRPVTLAVGAHVRAPRVYRGLDIQRWLDDIGLLDERYDEVDDITRVRRLPSLQIVGTPQRTTLDINALTANGVRLVGRLAGVSDGKAQFSGSLRNVCAMADLKLGRLLDTIDEWATDRGLDAQLEPSWRPEPTAVEASPPLGLELTGGDIRTIVWATGFRPDYSWLQIPVLDRKGQIRHDGGVVVDTPGMYLLGMPFLRRRKSTLIDGAGADTEELSLHLADYLDHHVAGRPACARLPRSAGERPDPQTGFLGAAPTSADVQRLYDADLKDMGYVMNVSRLWAHDAAALDRLSELLGHVVRAGSLTFRQRGILVTSCASALGDSYCSLAWGKKLAAEAGDDFAAGVLRGDDGELDESEKALAAWARQIARDPNNTDASDVRRLRDAGFDDSTIFSITVFVALRIAFSTVNDALGAQPDRQLADEVPTSVRDAVSFGRPLADGDDPNEPASRGGPGAARLQPPR
jgi:putative flavoprotein involved in K+ transport